MSLQGIPVSTEMDAFLRQQPLSAQQLQTLRSILSIDLSPEPITVNVTGTLSGPLGAISQCPPRTVWLNGTPYVNSGKWASFVAIRAHPNAIIELTDLEGIDSPNSISVLSPVTFPALKFANDITSAITSWPASPLSFPSLVRLGGGFINTTIMASSLSMPELVETSATIQTFGGAPNLTTINIPKIVVFGIVLGNNWPALTTITLPPVGVWKECASLSLNNAALNQATVDNILAHLAYMDGNNGTRALSPGTSYSIAGGTTSPPSNLGSVNTAGSNFICSGMTCTVNMANHGYNTGDVLRISGVATATNANRYAVITRVNANQFTYAISTQNATGSGTATVIRANNSVRALITRGVNLTTN